MRIRTSKIIDIIGAPSSIASPKKGSSLGPDAIRIAGLKAGLKHLDLEFIDSGNLPSLEEPFPPRFFQQGEIRYLDEVISFNCLLKSKVLESFQNGYFPLVLGGDHSVAIGSMSAATEYYKSIDKKPGLLWFDAHADYNTEETSLSGNIHGMPLAVATGKGNSKLLSIFQNNFFDPLRVVILGVRSVDPIEGEMLNDAGIKVFTMKDIDELGMLHCVKQAIKIISPRHNNPIHVSFDIDGIDITYSPGTGTPVWGGVTLREAHLMFEILDESGLMQSLDMVEVNPLLDIKNQTAHIANALLESALGKVIY